MSSRDRSWHRGLASIATAALVVAAPVPGIAQQLPADGSTSIKHDSDKARELKEPSFETREQRLAAQPLDWNSTLGTSSPRKLTARELRAIKTARATSSKPGAPNPKAEEEARRLHPDDWK